MSVAKHEESGGGPVHGAIFGFAAIPTIGGKSEKVERYFRVFQ
jgi:hypothetical protein